MGMKVYICSPFKGKTDQEVQENIDRAKNFSNHAAKIGNFPMCPHIYLENATGLSEKTGDRKRLLELGIQMLLMCEEIWICTERRSSGMIREIKIAKRRGIKIREVWMTQKQYYKKWCKENPKKVHAIKKRYEDKRKEQRKLIREEKERNKYF